MGGNLQTQKDVPSEKNKNFCPALFFDFEKKIPIKAFFFTKKENLFFQKNKGG